MNINTDRLHAEAQELLEVLKDLAVGADMMLQPIPVLSSNKALVRYAQEVRRVARAAIARVEEEEGDDSDLPEMPATETAAERAGEPVRMFE